MKSKISCIIPTLDRLNDVRELLESINTQTLIPEEVIIIDQSDTSDLLEFYNEYKLNYKFQLFYFHSEYKSLTRAKNLGVKKSSGDYIFCFDDDIILEKNYIFFMTETLESNKKYDGGTGLVANDSNFNIPILKNNILSLIFFHHQIKDGNFLPNGMSTYPKNLSNVSDVEFISGGLCVFRKNVFKKYCFDNNMLGYCYMEDDDFGYRVSKEYKLFFNPKAIAFHKALGISDINNRINKKCLFLQNFHYLFYKNFNKNLFQKLIFYWSLFGYMFIEAINLRIKALKKYLFILKKIKKRQYETLY